MMANMLRACTVFLIKHPLRETVKNYLLKQDPPYHKNDGGLFMYPPSLTSKDGVFVI